MKQTDHGNWTSVAVGQFVSWRQFDMVKDAEANARRPSKPRNVHRTLLSAAGQLRENYLQFASIKIRTLRNVSGRRLAHLRHFMGIDGSSPVAAAERGARRGGEILQD
jgi:hypothetical protein